MYFCKNFAVLVMCYVHLHSLETGFQVLMPELCRGLEMFLGLLLPIVVYCTLPAYSKFRQAPDDSDVKNEIHRLESIFCGL